MENPNRHNFKPPRPLIPLPPLSLPLRDGWRFTIDSQGAGAEQGWQQPDWNDLSWTPVEMPHTWNVVEAWKDYEGIAWYRCAFNLPETAQDGHLRLCFQAVFYRARVWLNGNYLGEHEGGYTPFEFDLDEAALPGEVNCLAVEVDNRRAMNRLPALLPEGRSYGWKNYGGIVREVAIELTSRAYIVQQRLVAIPHLAGVDAADSASLQAVATVRNSSDRGFHGMLAPVIIEEGSGMEIRLRPTAPFQVPAGESLEVAIETTLTQPRLWHFDHPHLYRWTASLLDAGGAEMHRAASTFGIRLIELKDNRLYLNGEPVRLVGLSRHADVPGHGLAEGASVMAADFDDLKRLNMVFARPVHYPQAEFTLDYCDRHGILLSPEVPAWQLSANQMADPHLQSLERQQLREMIAAGFNHPCIWAWSVGNELESDTSAGREFVRQMIAYAKELDPTRPVSFASYHLLVGRPWADATRYADFVMMNEYFGTWHGPKGALELALDTVHAAFPEKTVFVSEFGFHPHWQRVEGPQWLDPAQYYITPPEAAPDSDAADQLRIQVLADQMAVFRRKPFVAGAVFWCYRGVMGVVDETGRQRLSWQALRREFSPVILESTELLPSLGTRQQAALQLRARGPVGEDLPAYTLRGYLLLWAAVAQDGVIAEGEIELPELAPGERWQGVVDWESSTQTNRLAVSVLRPTGFAALEEIIDL